MTVYEDLQKTDSLLFSLQFFVADESRNGEVTEITSDVISFGAWQGEVAESVYGWSLSLTGKNQRSIFVSGNTLTVYRGPIDYKDENGSLAVLDGEYWYVGKILTVESAYSWQTQDWNMRVVDPLTYYSSRVSPIISTTQANVARYATASADSYTVAANILGQGEVVGNPVLTPDRAIDSNMSTLWVSAKSPSYELNVGMGNFSLASLSEVWAWPVPALDKQQHTWLELSLINRINYPDQPSDSYVRIMSRYGIIDFKDKVSFGDVYGPSSTSPEAKKARFLALCYDSGIHQSVWGQSPNHCPVMEWKNLPSTQHRPRDNGRVAGSRWGFNLDGNGDFIALSWNVHPDDYTVAGTLPWGRDDPLWTTMFIEGGSQMSKLDNSAVFGTVVSNTVIEVHFSQQRPANYFAGCFISAVPDTPAPLNSVRYILSHTATGASPPYVSRVTTYDFPWDSINFYPGYALKITPWPAKNWNWTAGVTSTGFGKSWKTKNYGMENLSSSAWEEDRFPSVGYSGPYQGHETLSWLLLNLDNMSFVTTSPVIFGDTRVEVASSDGLTPTGYIYIDLEGPYEYTEKTATTITLASSYSGAGAPSGATITQATQSGASIPQWPVNYISVKRKAVSTARELRLIKKMYVYGTNVPAARTPGDEEFWYEDWTQVAATTNNLSALVLEWNTSELRYSDYLFVIHEMNDASQGRINEIVLGMPDTVVTSVLENVTVASFFEYVLIDLMGFGSDTVDTTSCPAKALGEFSTDSVAYMAVLSDMCRRAGAILAALPNGDIVVAANAGWVNAPTFNLIAIDTNNTTALNVDRIDDRSISQVQVTTQDYQGNTLLGKYPPTPRFFGEPYREPDLFSTGNTDPNIIARYIFSKKTSPMVSCSTVGPALWPSPGLSIVDINYPGSGGQGQDSELDGNWLVSSVDHDISFGSKQVPATWATKLSLIRV